MAASSRWAWAAFEHFDGACHVADLVAAVVSAPANLQIAGSHSGHYICRVGERLEHVAAEQAHGADDERHGADACHPHYDEQRGHGRRTAGDKGIARGGRVFGQQQDRAAFAGEDGIELLLAGLGPCHVATVQRREQHRVDFLPERIGFLRHRSAQFAGECRVNIISRPPREAGAVLLFEFGKIGAVLGEVGRIIDGLPRLERRFNDVERRG